MPSVLGLGDNTVDTYIDAGAQYPGGNAVNVAVFCRRLGAAAGYLGCLGDDEAGQLVFDALSIEGVDLSRCRRLAGANARALIAHRNGDRQFVASSPGVRARYALADEDFAYIARHELTHTSIYSELEAELPRIRAATPCLSFDYSEKWSLDSLAKTLPHVNIAFLSHPRRADAECVELLQACAARGGAVIVVTRGAAGAVALAEGRIVMQGIVPTRVVDTLGAGDGFIAGFLVTYLRKDTLEAALAAGAEFAAEVCTWRGAFGHGVAWHGTVSAGEPTHWPGAQAP